MCWLESPCSLSSPGPWLFLGPMNMPAHSQCGLGTFLTLSGHIPPDKPTSMYKYGLPDFEQNRPGQYLLAVGSYFFRASTEDSNWDFSWVRAAEIKSLETKGSIWERDCLPLEVNSFCGRWGMMTGRNVHSLMPSQQEDTIPKSQHLCRLGSYKV